MVVEIEIWLLKKFLFYLKNRIIFIELYKKTFLNTMLKIEKRFYSSLAKRIQIIINWMFIYLTRITFILKRKSFKN